MDENSYFFDQTYEVFQREHLIVMQNLKRDLDTDYNQKKLTLLNSLMSNILKLKHLKKKPAKT